MRTSWSVIDYVTELQSRGVRCSGQQIEMEVELLTLFPPNEPVEDIYEPCIFTDCDGRILAWNLPGLIGPDRKVS